ncbi:hypothetical protein ETU10_08505 [Apibacter muscae]|uniref:hypothetical protein n=1 Tax=Apibacter muscae TaxID=2509004 RepID=UPI0011ACA632|nr:hypothetical protein [Apibacter muscae]TWP23127.1 hypothetical protein ETU10_08505 [Apibacter muscae]
MNKSKEKGLEVIGRNVCEKILIPNYDRLKLRASGQWSRMLDVRTRGNTIEILGANYTHYMIHGRASGKLPPIAAIALWLKQKGIKANPYAVAKTIAKNGTRTFQKGENNLLKVLEDSKNKQEIALQVGKVLLPEYQQRLIEILKKLLKNGH